MINATETSENGHHSPSKSRAVMFIVEDKVVFLTGALGGLGTCFVRELLKNKVKGIALVDINDKFAERFQNELSKLYGDGKTLFIKADLTDPSQIELAYEKTIEHFKQLDIVINNAGMFAESDFLKNIQTNFVATAYSTNLALMKYLEPHRTSDEAVVINIASIAGLYNFPMFPAYSTCKQAIVALGRSLGDDVHYNAKKIRIVTICPGVTDTAFLKQISERPNYIKPTAMDSLNAFGYIQKPENVSNALIGLIQNGQSGCAYVVTNDQPAEKVDFSTIDSEGAKMIA